MFPYLNQMEPIVSAALLLAPFPLTHTALCSFLRSFGDIRTNLLRQLAFFLIIKKNYLQKNYLSLIKIS